MICAVASCRNCSRRAARAGKFITFHRFPTNKDIRETWIESCQRPDQFNVQSSHVCSEHFDEDDFEKDFRAELMGEKSRRRLKPGVVPHLNLPEVKTPDASHEIKQHIVQSSIEPGEFVECILLEPQLDSCSGSGESSTSTLVQPTTSSAISFPDYKFLFKELQKRHSCLMTELVKERKLRLKSTKMAILLKKENKKLFKYRFLIKKFARQLNQIKCLKQLNKSLQREISNIAISNERRREILQFFTDNEEKIVLGHNFTVHWTNNDRKPPPSSICSLQAPLRCRR